MSERTPNHRPSSTTNDPNTTTRSTPNRARSSAPHARAADHALVDGRPWDGQAVNADVQSIAGPGARLVPFDGPERFDVLPLLVATDRAIAAFGYDGRRLRPNLVIGGVEGLRERDWPGARLQVGDVLIGVQDLRLRCIMTSFDPDTQAQDREVTRGIYRRFDGKLALDCYVIEGGEIAVGDAVELVHE